MSLRPDIGHDKPDPEGCPGAAGGGLRTACVPRPLERGDGGPVAPWTVGEFDVVAADFLARDAAS